MSRQMTQSFHNYKGWDFSIRAIEGNGIWSTIFKDLPRTNLKGETLTKRLPLRQKGWSFMEVDKLIQQTKDFIDNHESNLYKSLETQKIKHHIL